MKTTCPYCGVGCGLDAQPDPAAGSREKQRAGERCTAEAGTPGACTAAGPEATGPAGPTDAARWAIAPDPHHPANFGRICSKGAALADTLGADGRLLHPQIRGERASWDRALSLVAEGFMRIAREHGPEAVALYVSGQLLTEDYYVANKLMKGFIGCANIDTNSRLCMASAVAGHRRAFGEDVVPGCYEDFELADLVVLAGSNTAWCHPVLYQRIAEAKARRPQMKVVVIDPRRTATCDIADLHLPIRPGTDVWLFNGLLAYLERTGSADKDFLAAHTSGAAEALATAEETASDLFSLASVCGLDDARLEEFFCLFANTQRVVTAFSQGVNQSSAGTDKVNSIINCHLLTGRIGQPGMGPFSLTGQPNAMGGREVGGMANMLAAHMEIENEAHRRIVQRFWESPCIPHRPGLKAVDLFEAIHAGRVKAIWIMATNPVVSLPDADRAREALACCELVVVSDCAADTDTARLAHVLLPAHAWGEKDGTVTNSERRISRQRAFLPPAGEAMPDWWIVCEVARRMGFGGQFPYRSPHEIFDEHARLSAAENEGTRLFDIGGLAGLTREEYDALEPVQWPVRRPMAGPVRLPESSAARADHSGRATASPCRAIAPTGAARPSYAGTARLFGDGRFMHPDGRARLIATRPRMPAHALDETFPMVLNTGRIRDQWHTMTRTGRSARLSEHIPEPFVDLHGQDALLAGVRPGELARIVTRWGSMIGRARTSGEIARGQVFAPMHWNAVVASEGRVGALVSPAVDPVSGEPELKHTPARVEPFLVDWYGVVVSRRPIGAPAVTWWAAVRIDGGMRYELAGRGAPPDRTQWARHLLGIAGAADEGYLEYFDEGSAVYRAARIAGDRLEACLYVSRRPELPQRRWLASLLTRPIAERDRVALLAGRPLDGAGASAGERDDGPLVCSCFRVSRETITRAIERHALRDAREVGARLRAGTSCGSCLPEIRALLAAAASAD